MKNNPTHSLTDDHFDDKPEKEYAMELTWTESWANVFSLMAQKYYKNKYTNVFGFGDNSLNKNDLEKANKELYNSCEAQELAVSKVLWDLFDSSLTGDIGESHDNISLNCVNNIINMRCASTKQNFRNMLSSSHHTAGGKILPSLF